MRLCQRTSASSRSLRSRDAVSEIRIQNTKLTCVNAKASNVNIATPNPTIEAASPAASQPSGAPAGEMPERGDELSRRTAQPNQRCRQRRSRGADLAIGYRESEHSGVGCKTRSGGWRTPDQAPACDLLRPALVRAAERAPRRAVGRPLERTPIVARRDRPLGKTHSSALQSSLGAQA